MFKIPQLLTVSKQENTSLESASASSIILWNIQNQHSKFMRLNSKNTSAQTRSKIFIFAVTCLVMNCCSVFIQPGSSPSLVFIYATMHETHPVSVGFTTTIGKERVADCFSFVWPVITLREKRKDQDQFHHHHKLLSRLGKTLVLVKKRTPLKNLPYRLNLFLYNLMYKYCSNVWLQWLQTSHKRRLWHKRRMALRCCGGVQWTLSEVVWDRSGERVVRLWTEASTDEDCGTHPLKQRTHNPSPSYGAVNI